MKNGELVQPCHGDPTSPFQSFAMGSARLKALCHLCVLLIVLGDVLAQTYKPDLEAGKKSKFREGSRQAIDLRAGSLRLALTFSAFNLTLIDLSHRSFAPARLS